MLKAWLTALRPASLPIAVGPVLAGTAAAWQQQGRVPWLLACCALLAALLMQVITNLQNDVGFTRRGGEAVGQRTGQPRATAQGWLTLAAVQRAVLLCSLLALGLGLLMLLQRGWPVLLIGTLSLAAALAYMGGPRPIAYTAWGEVTVFAFFGLVAVGGTEWLLTGAVSNVGWLSAVVVGSTAAAALAINNHRDIAHDRQVGRHTFAVRFGAQASTWLLALLLTLPYATAIVLAWLQRSAWPLSLVLLLPRSWALFQRFLRVPDGTAYNVVLFGVFRLGLAHALLWSAALVALRLSA